MNGKRTKAVAISNVAVESPHDHPNYALRCEFEGNVYQVWIDVKTGEPDPVMYKGPPTNLSRSDPGFFHPRKLDLNGALGRKLYPAMVAARDEQNLVQQWRDRLAAAEASEQAARDEELARQRVKEAAPALLKALQQIMALGAGATITEAVLAVGAAALAEAGVPMEGK
jgi:hypothetical protein